METSVLCFFLLVFASCSIWSTEVKRNEQFLWLSSGESLTMRCSTNETDYDGVYLLLGLHEDKQILFLFGRTKKLSLLEGYGGRLRTEGELNNLKITLANMTEDDSGVYWCKYRRMDEQTGSRERFGGDGSTIVVVNGRPCLSQLSCDTGRPCLSQLPCDTCRPCTKEDGTVLSSNLVIVIAISAGSVFLLCLTVLLIWLVPRMKKSMGQLHIDSVYEDMRNMPQRAHQPTHQTNKFA